MTRQQRYMTQALEHVTAVKAQQSESVRTIYGGLCHQIPVLVRACGLCQTLAFVAEKAQAAEGQTDRARAYQLWLRHIADALKTPEDSLLDLVRAAPMLDYMRHTRTVLDAAIYYKRFAGSILKVTTAQAAEGAGGGQ